MIRHRLIFLLGGLFLLFTIEVRAQNTCSHDNTLSTQNIGCCATPDEPSIYYEFIEADVRKIYTTDFPNHKYCYNPNLIPDPMYYLFGINKNPSVAQQITALVRDNGRPARYFGVAKNGVIMAPAPAQPFIFENPNTGQFNWDWVFEPTNNQGDGQGLVKLDCASAHTGPQGYHYHGNMYEYMEQEVPGITTTATPPSEIIHIGWASDGFPIVYRFGPDENGVLQELQPSYQLREGERPGDGIAAPCGPYNGKYTNDYEYNAEVGDLDACNGVQRSISIRTASGEETFTYFYVITSTFPQIPRCLMGVVSPDFENSANPLNGIDGDNDGFLSQFDCDDTNDQIFPTAAEVIGNDIDENCDGLLTSTSATQFGDRQLMVSPNPSSGSFSIDYEGPLAWEVNVFAMDGRLVITREGRGAIVFEDFAPGMYWLQMRLNGQDPQVAKIVIQ